MIVLDTSILSVAFRRPRSGVHDEAPGVSKLRELIASDHAIGIPGIVLQELLAVVTSRDHHRRLLAALDGFDLLLADRATHVRAAGLSTDCRAAGILTSATDCLIAAEALLRGRTLFTLDADFERIAQVAPLKLLRH